MDVKTILDYQIENSCDEKLLKLMANRVNKETKINDVKLAAGVVSRSILNKFANQDSSLEDRNKNPRLIEVTPLPEEFRMPPALLSPTSHSRVFVDVTSQQSENNL